MNARLVRMLTGLAVLGAVLVAPQATAAPARAAYPRCVHPWPCGDGREWPRNLVGPFDPLPAQRVRVASYDGTPLGGWLFRPTLPRGVRAPVVLVSTPYDGFSADMPSSDDSTAPIAALVEQGYAVAQFSVRGTGSSGGCFENKGRREQRDQAHLVEWLARQDWSNGRVAMTGLSYPGTTPFEAAIHNPPHLKTIVPMGLISDVYTEMFTPQGAMYTTGGANETGRRLAVSGSPAAGAGDLAGFAPTFPQRACAEFARVLTQAGLGQLRDERDEAYWDDRRLIDGFPKISAAVFAVHGFGDVAHPFQEDPVWAALRRAPKRMLVGQWGHEPPSSGGFEGWREQLLGWFDFWLKGLGTTAPRLGVVDYADDSGRWRSSRSWPPAEVRDEVLYLRDDGELARTPSPGARSFRSAPTARTSNVPGGAARSAPGWPMCDEGTGTHVAYASAPLPRAALLAGNPFAYLNITADQPGGLVGVGLYSLAPEQPCSAARLLSQGVADLRFHDGRLIGRAFPTGRPTRVRVDLTNLAAVVPAGHRLVTVLSGNEWFSRDEVANPLADQRTSRSSQPYFPVVGVLGGAPANASHIVLPFVGSGLGGARPALRYPPRPFALDG